MNRQERYNEDQCHFFGFSPMALGDDVFNEIISSWERQVGKLLDTPQWSKLKGDKKARAALINILFAKGSGESLEAMADQISEYAHLNVFKISNNVVLPGTEPLQDMGSVEPDDIRRRVMRAERRVEEAKKRTALLRHEKADANERLTVIREFAHQLGYVKKNDSSCGDTTIRINDSIQDIDSSVMESREENKENDDGEEKMDDTEVERERAVIEEEEVERRKNVEGGDNIDEMMERSLTMED
ncbi:hypothetical protein PMAYCL1PPCAC_28968 [Pristionchus mayeri]|uniref:Uncharacterized protein n=1 Tax=Pristionchus mayeri TaxID=1317129 RepID=A0AAN5D8F6_9BILA|nr:hypothetical protein PMAYCL1PPCAC_28968 [Pristionchus mayeri]